MEKVSFKEYKNDKILVLVNTEEAREIMARWCKRHGDTSDINYDVFCEGCYQVVGVDELEKHPLCRIVSVYQLDGWDEPEVLEVTMSDVCKKYGRKVKIVKEDK
jgi:hypothetical protein